MGILSGIRIVEFDALGPVPFLGMVMAGHGADIVRIVRPGAPVMDKLAGGIVLHRNRASVELDLKKPADRDRALRLIATADALMEGFRPGVMERLGLGPEPCLAANPGLVYGRMTGWGQSGPLAHRAGHDINYLSITGALGAIGPADRPVAPLNLVADYAGGGMFLGFGLLAALLRARQTGRGSVIDAAMCDAVPVLLSLFHAFAGLGSWSDNRESNLLDGGAPYYRCYRCSDGQFVAVGALEPQFYAELMSGLGLDQALYPQDDRANWMMAQEAIAGIFLTRTRDEWATHFADRDACVTPVLSLSESFSAPHLLARGVFERHGTTTMATAAAPRFDNETPSSTAAERYDADQAIARWSR